MKKAARSRLFINQNESEKLIGGPGRVIFIFDFREEFKTRRLLEVFVQDRFNVSV